LCVDIAAVGSGGRQRAKELVCRSNLHQWGCVFESFARDHDGYLLNGEGLGFGYWWIQVLWPYHNEGKLLLCPAATQSLGNGVAYEPFAAWQSGSYVGSYSINGWVCDPHQASGMWGHTPASNYWRTPSVQGRENVPVFADAWWVDAWPQEIDQPWQTSGRIPDSPSTDNMIRVCVNRHDGAVNCLFMDWSVRKVGLKGLWTLKWHRNYNPDGPWTITGGIHPEDWPEWMRQFRDY